MYGNVPQVPLVPQVPQVPTVPTVPTVPRVPSVPYVPNIGNLGTFNNNVNNFINTNSIINPFDDPSRFRSLGDVLLSRKLIRESNSTISFFENALGWVGDNVVRNIPIIGQVLDDTVDNIVESAKSGYDSLKETEFVGDIVSAFEDYTIRWQIGLSERLLGFVNDALIEPFTWGSDPYQGAKLELLSIMNAVGKDLDLVTGANAIKSIAIPALTYAFTNGKEGTINPEELLHNLAKSVGLDEEAGLTHYEWNTGIGKMKDIPGLGDITQLLVDVTDPIKDWWIIGILNDLANMTNEISLLDFGLEILSSPDTYVDFGISGALDALGKKMVKAGSPLGDLTVALSKTADDATTNITKRATKLNLLKNIKSMGPIDAFTEYYYTEIINNLNNKEFLNTLTDGRIDTFLKRIKSDNILEVQAGSDALKLYIKQQLTEYFTGNAPIATRYGIQHAYEIVERWRKVSNTMEQLQSLARYNNPVYSIHEFYNQIAKPFFQNIYSNYTRRKVAKLKAIPKDGYFYDNYILNRADREVLDEQLKQNIVQYINNLPREFRDTSDAGIQTFLDFYNDALDIVLKSEDYLNGVLTEADVHRRAVRILIERLEKLHHATLPDNVKKLLTEIRIKGQHIKLSKQDKLIYTSFSELVDKLRTAAFANKIKTLDQMSSISAYYNEIGNTLATAYKTNYMRLKNIKQNIITKGRLSDYKNFFREAHDSKVAEHAIKEFENLLDNMRINPKDLRKVDALLELKDTNIKDIERVFRKNKMLDKNLLDTLRLNLDKKYKTLITAQNLDTYKNLFRNRKMYIDEQHYIRTIREASNELFGKVIHKEITLDLGNKINLALTDYDAKLNTEHIIDIFANKNGVWAKIDEASRLNERRIIAGDVERTKVIARNLSKSFESLFNYKEYVRYTGNGDAYKIFSDELINNLSQTFKKLEPFIPGMDTVKDDLIPLYKKILEKLNTADLDEALTEQQVSKLITSIIIKEYLPSDLQLIADDLQNVGGPLRKLIADLYDANKPKEATNVLATMTSIELKHFKDYITALTSENIVYDFKKLADATDTLYKLKTANRLNQLYLMQCVTNNKELYDTLHELIREGSLMNHAITGIIDICKRAEDPSIRMIAKDIETLIDDTKGMFNYIEFYTELQDILNTFSVSSELNNIISNELQNIITTGVWTTSILGDKEYTIDPNKILNYSDIDAIMDELYNKTQSSFSNTKVLNRMSEDVHIALQEQIQRIVEDDVRRLQTQIDGYSSSPVQITFYKPKDLANDAPLNNRNRYNFILTLPSDTSDETREAVENYLRMTFKEWEGEVINNGGYSYTIKHSASASTVYNFLKEKGVSAGDLYNLISMHNDPDILINVPALSFVTHDALDNVRPLLERYIKKQVEDGLSLYTFYNHDTLTATKNISDSLDIILDYLNTNNQYSEETLSTYIYSLLNMFQGSKKTSARFYERHQGHQTKTTTSRIINAEEVRVTPEVIGAANSLLDESMAYGNIAEVLTNGWNDINTYNDYLLQYGVFDPKQMEKASAGIAASLYDIVFERIRIPEGAISSESLIKLDPGYMAHPDVILRTQQKQMAFRQKARNYRKAAENIVADRAFFIEQAAINPKFNEYLKSFNHNVSDPSTIINSLSKEEIIDLKHLFSETAAARTLTFADATEASYTKQAFNYHNIFNYILYKDLTELDISYVRSRLAWMFKDPEFAASTIPIVKDDLYTVLLTTRSKTEGEYTESLIKNIAFKLGDNAEQATILYQKLNEAISKGAYNEMAHDLYLYCLNKIEDPAQIMAWYTVVINNKKLYETLQNYDRFQKVDGDAAQKYIRNVESQTLADKNNLMLLENGGIEEALNIDKNDLDIPGGVFRPRRIINEAPKTLYEKIDRSQAVAQSIQSGKASFDVLMEINHIFDSFKGKYKKGLKHANKTIQYEMEQHINDLSIQTLLSLDVDELKDFLIDNYGMVYIAGDDIVIPWTTEQLKHAKLNMKQVGNGYTIYNIDPNITYSKAIGTKQFRNIKVDKYRDTLDKLNPLKKKLNVYTNEAYTPFGDDLFIPRTISRDTIQGILDDFKIQDAYLNQHFFNENYTRMDNIMFVASNYRALQQQYGLNYQITLTRYYQNIIKNENMKAKYIDAVFREETFRPETFADILDVCQFKNDQEVSQFFDENKLVGVVVSTSTKGDVVFPKIDTVKIHTRKDLQTLIDHPDVAGIVPRTMAYNMLTAINDHAADSRLVEVLRLMNYTWKVGIVAKPGQILRNLVDTLVKNINESGRSLPEEIQKRKVAGFLNNLYDEIYTKCFALYGDVNYKHLDTTLESMLQNSNLTQREKIIIKKSMYLVNELNKSGALDSEVMILKRIQDQYNKRYLQGWSKISKDYIDLVQDLPYIKQMLSANSAIERTARLSLALDQLRQYKDIPSIIEKIDQVHFNYADKSTALQKAELLVPFIVFPTKNKAYWLNEGFKTNELYRMMYIGLKQSWRNENGTFGQIFYRDKEGNIKVDPYATDAIASGSVRVGDYIIKTGWSYLDAMNTILNPIGEAQGRLNPAIQFAMSGGTDTYSGFSMIPFVGPELYRMYKGQRPNRVLFGNTFTNDYTINTLRKNTRSLYPKRLYYKYPAYTNININYGRYPKVSYKAVHSSNRTVAFKRYYGKMRSFDSIYKPLYPKKNYSIVQLKRWQAQNPHYYSDTRNIVSSVKRIKAMFR